MAQGKGFLKVCGILMIIGGALTIIVSGILGLVGAATVGAVAGAAYDIAAEGAEAEAAGALIATGGATLIVAAVLSIIGGILELVAGIVGVKNCNKPEKSTACVVWGIIVLVINLISTILSVSGGSAGAGTIIVSIIFSIALPVLYLIGAFLNKKKVAA